MERLQLVGFNGCLVFVQVGERVLRTVVVSIVVCIDGLSLQPGDSVELLDGGSSQSGQSSEYCTFDLGDLSILDSIDQCVLCLGGMVLQLFGSVFLSERSDF